MEDDDDDEDVRVSDGHWSAVRLAIVLTLESIDTMYMRGGSG